MRHHHLSAYQFERECGIANGYLKKQSKGKGTMGSELLEKISVRYSDLNLSWLITGKGKMLLDSSYMSHTNTSNLSEDPSAYTANEIAVKALQEKIAILERALGDKEKIIRLLEEKNN